MFLQIVKKKGILHIKLRISSLQKFAISKMYCIMQFLIFLRHAIQKQKYMVTRNKLRPRKDKLAILRLL